MLSRVEGFYKTIDNLIVNPNPDPATNQHDFITSGRNLQNSGSGWSKGGEFFIRKKVGSRFLGWISYTYAVSRRKLTPTGSEIPATYDQNNILTVLGSYQFSRKWELSMKWHSHTGNPYTPVDSVTNNGFGGLTSNYGPVNSARFPSY